jgi:hypothetical protein
MTNLNASSQFIRIVLGILLIIAAWYGPQTQWLTGEWQKLWTLGWFGLIPLISGIIAFCPLYAVLGFGHKPKDSNKAPR